MSKVVDGPYKLGDGDSKREGDGESSCRNCSYRALTSWVAAMATVRGRAGVKAALGIATIEPLQVGCGDCDSKREGGGESSCRNCI